MKKNLLVWLGLVAMVASPLALAQEPPAMVSVLSVHGKLGHQQHYEMLLEDIWAAFKKAGVSRPIFVGSGVDQPGLYTFAVGVSNLADLDSFNAKINQAYASIPGVMKEAQSTFSHWDQEIWLSRPDLSYRPADPRVPAEEMSFTRIVFLYPHPEHAQDFQAVMKEANEVRKKHGLRDGTESYQLGIGAGGPAFAVLIGGKDEADFYVENAKAQTKMAGDWQAIAQKAGPMLRKIEYASSSARTDLAFTP